jgi:hypothetical protein
VSKPSKRSKEAHYKSPLSGAPTINFSALISNGIYKIVYSYFEMVL